MGPLNSEAFPDRFPKSLEIAGENLLAILATIGRLRCMAFEFVHGLGRGLNDYEVTFSQWYAAVVWEVSRERIPPRRNRINPRVIKRKMSRWNKCRPEHRKQKPLTQTFHQTVVMLH